MKKFLVLPLIILPLLFSCASTEEPLEIVPTEEPVVTETPVSEPEPVPVVEVKAEPAIESTVEEIPAEKEEVVAESETTEEVSPVEEAPVVETPDVRETEPEVEAAPVTPALRGKELINQISEEEKAVKEAKAAAREAPEKTEEVKEEKKDEAILPPVVVAKSDDGDKPEPPTVTVVPSEPAVTETVAEVKNVPEPPQTQKTEERSVLDTALDGDIMEVLVEIMTILVIFTLSTVIRNRYTRPLSVGLSIVLALLFTSIPMLISFILFGWSNMDLMYLVLLGTVFIFNSRRGH